MFLGAPFVHLQTYWIGSNVVFSLVVFIMFKIMFCSTQQNFSNSWKIHPGVHQSCQRGRRANWKCPTWDHSFCTVQLKQSGVSFIAGFFSILSCFSLIAGFFSLDTGFYSILAFRFSLDTGFYSILAFRCLDKVFLSSSP